MKKSLFSLAFVLFFISTQGSGIRGGQITVIVLNGTSCEIILQIFSTKPETKCCVGWLDFGDGNSTTIPSNAQGITTTLDQSILAYQFAISHVYRSPGFYRITFTEENLDEGIENVANSEATPFYLESRFLIDPSANPTPFQFQSQPIFKAFLGEEFSFSTAPVDTTYMYTYEFTKFPLIDVGYPENFKINNQTGMITWDAKLSDNNLPGQYFIMVKINQYNKNRILLGYVVRSVVINLVTDTSRLSIQNPILDPIGKIKVKEPKTVRIKLSVSDSTNSDSLKWVAFYSDALSKNINFIQYDSSSASSKTRIAVFTFTSTESITRDLPYTVTLRAVSYGQSFGYAAYDVSYLIFTKDSELPVITEVNKQDPSISIFPNPCSDELFISGMTNQLNAIFFNGLGQFISESKADDEMKLDVSQLTPGIYILVLREGNQTARFKVIKK